MRLRPRGSSLLSKKTVLVLGAGASSEYHLPVGSELAKQIAGLFDADGDVNSLGFRDDVFRRFVAYSSLGKLGSAQDIRYATRRIADGLPKSGSIDEFLYINSNKPMVVKIGKAAIAYSLLMAEKSAGILPSGDISNLKSNFVAPKTYMHELWGLLRRGHSTADFSGVFDNLSVVSFNYDRVFISAMRELLTSTFDAQHDAICEIVGKFTIIYPYGSLGEWSPGMQAWRGEKDLFERIDRATGSILTYYESQALHRVSECHACIEDADNIVFLGFGFHDQNNNFIPRGEISQGKSIYATTRGLKNTRVLKVRGMLRDKFNANDAFFHFKPAACHELVDEILDWL